MILQNNVANRSSPITIVVAITSTFDEENDGVRGEPIALWPPLVQMVQTFMGSDRAFLARRRQQEIG